MAKQPKEMLNDHEDIAPEWPMTRTYTEENGILVRVFKAAHCAAGINKFSARPKKAANVIGL